MIKELMIQINEECFSGKLDLNFPVHIIKDQNVTGNITFSNSYPITVLSLEINERIDWTKNNRLKNFLAHEMIHVYEIQILKSKPEHKFNFIKEMNRINGLGYKVTILSYLSLKAA